MSESGQLLSVIVVPHPPIMVKEVAKAEYEKVKQTAEAMEALAEDINNLKPEALIIISPHGPVFSDAIGIYDAENLKGSLAQFGVPQISVEMQMDKKLAELIIIEAKKEGVYAAPLDKARLKSFGLSSELDHGVVAPISFFKKPLPPAVIMGMGLLTPIELYSFGIALKRAIELSGKSVVVVASGDMSHKISEEAPAGYHPHGKLFDKAVYDALMGGDFKALFNIPADVCENAGECGYRSLLMGVGALEGQRVESKIYSYQAPFGVGYLIAFLKPVGEDKVRYLLPEIKKQQNKQIENIRQKESLPVRLARQTIESFVKEQALPKPSEIDIGQNGKAGVFVSIKKNGQLRGCIGTTGPTTDSITQEIINNAINAASQDPRFYPVTEDELSQLTYSVDILTPAVPVKDVSELDPKKYGVIVKKGHRSGLLLPDLEGVNTVKEQLEIALNKAGISGNDYDIMKFEVIRYK